MKGEIRKLKSEPLTINDYFVKDGLEAISTLTGKEPYYLVGGVATQSYLPTSCRRPTSDIDLSIVKPLVYEDFKILSKPVFEYLSDNGYHVQLSKHQRAFNLEVENKEGSTLLIEFSRRNAQSFEHSKNKLERELRNSKRKIIEKRNSTYITASSEDIIVPKLARSIKGLVRNPSLKSCLPSKDIPLSEEYIKERLDFIRELREKSMFNNKDLYLFDKLKFVSDLFDVRILSEVVGINLDYFNESILDWSDAFFNHPLEKDLLCHLLPHVEVSHSLI
jgi:hypothetical protein